MKRLILLFALLSSFAIRASAATPPNILVTFTDDHGYADLS